VLALLILVAGASSMAAAEPVPFKVGISEAVNTALAIWIAEQGGFYTAQGLEVEIINMQGGSRGAQELQAGRIDAMHAGGDLRIVASLSNEIRFTFFVRPGVTSAADLERGVVGVSTFGSESDATVTLALKKLGLGRDAVVMKEYGPGTRRIEAVRSGEITATAVNEPVTSMAYEQGLKAMVDLAADHIPWLFSSIVVKQSYLAAHRDVVTRFVKATMEGNYLALANERLAKDILARETGVTDPKIIDISYVDFKLQTPTNIEPTRQAAENVIANYPPGGSSRVEDYIDAGIIEQLKKEGFVEALQRKYER
jgi:ABC-type nitrate/sulfonate/bicarbonate transport system substrate-binding protein